MLGVAEAEVEVPTATLFEEAEPGAREPDVRLAGATAEDLDVLPAERMADAGTEGLRDGFFGGEARCQVGCRRLEGEAVRDFGGAKNAFQEAFAEPLMGGLDSVDLDDVDADAEDHAAATIPPA